MLTDLPLDFPTDFLIDFPIYFLSDLLPDPLTDLLTGLLWGGIVGWLTYLVWQKYFGPKRSSRGMQGDPNIQTLGGYAVIDVNIFINSLILTYLFIAIAAFIIV